MAGGYGAGDPPDPIPNSEVKTRCADGTAGATRWESTAPPAYLSQTPASIIRDRSGRLSYPPMNGEGVQRNRERPEEQRKPIPLLLWLLSAPLYPSFLSAGIPIRGSRSSRGLLPDQPHPPPGERTDQVPFIRDRDRRAPLWSTCPTCSATLLPPQMQWSGSPVTRCVRVALDCAGNPPDPGAARLPHRPLRRILLKVTVLNRLPLRPVPSALMGQQHNERHVPLRSRHQRSHLRR
jgi:hypothetical protein